MKLDWRPHFVNGYSIAKHNGYSIIRSSLSSVKRNHLCFMGGANYEVMDRQGDIHRFNSRKEMEEMVSK